MADAMSRLEGSGPVPLLLGPSVITWAVGAETSWFHIRFQSLSLDGPWPLCVRRSLFGDRPLFSHIVR